MRGFLSVLDGKVIDALKNSEKLDSKELDLPDFFSFVARKGAEAIAMEHFRCESAGVWETGIKLGCVDSSQSIFLQFGLDFKDEEFLFDPLTDVSIHLNSQSLESIDAVINAKNFLRCIFCNGKLEVWNDDGDRHMGQSKPYIPKDMYFDLDAHHREMTVLADIREKFIAGTLSSDPSKL